MESEKTKAAAEADVAGEAKAAAEAAGAGAGESSEESSEQENKPKNLIELKITLQTVLAKELKQITNNDDDEFHESRKHIDLDKSLKDFFTNFDIKKVNHFGDIDAAIKKLKAYNDKINPIKEQFIKKVSSYVDAAALIYDDLDTFFSDSILEINKKLTTDAFPNMLKVVNDDFMNILEAVTALKKKEPATDSSDTPLTDSEKEINKHLDELNKFLENMKNDFVPNIIDNFVKEFSVAEIKTIIESDPNNYDELVSAQVNKICKKLLDYVIYKADQFRKLLDIQNSDGAKIIDNSSSIDIPFNALIEALKEYFVENGDGDDNLFTQLTKFYRGAVESISEEINKKVAELKNVPALGKIPLMANDDSESSGVGGDGNENASTFVSHSVSNKSKKNRNKGKGKGKSRKPNATKKNNRR